MIIDDDGALVHYGILRRSGRYPYGSGGDQSGGGGRHGFLDEYEALRKQGMGEAEAAKAVGSTTTQIRRAKTIALAQQKQAFVDQAVKLKAKGMSNVAIGKRMNIPESSVRSYLKASESDRIKILDATSDALKREVEKTPYLDVGIGVERHMGISKQKLEAAVGQLQNEGYKIHYVKVTQVGTGEKTTLKVLTKADVPYSQVLKNRDHIRSVTEVSEDGGRSFTGIQPPLSISSKRVAVKYGNEGGSAADGVIYVRPGVKDLSLGSSRYAQVRIAVDGTHYLKGMAMYKDDLPHGVDLLFNTNKNNTGNKLDAMKELKRDKDGNIDKDLPFGSLISRQIGVTGSGGTKKLTSVMNVVNDEGDWAKWSNTLSSQMLSKQSPALAKTQLDMMRQRKEAEFESIMKLTNPAVRARLLKSFSDDADSSAVHLKAAGLPGQRTHVILPINSLKETEVYAPNFRNGDRVALVRFPHGGTFEIPQLTVNNRNAEGKKLIGVGEKSIAIGINHKVAQRLSGADFDGDTVLVIPNNKGLVKSSPALAGLQNFDPVARYPHYDGMPKMSNRIKQLEMGRVSNLITDMTIKGASTEELARAVRHSMVVIDAEKHYLNYKQSEQDNGIAQLKAKYQSGPRGGASTVVSQRKSVTEVPHRKDGFLIDKATGQKVFRESGETITRGGKIVPRTQKVGRLANAVDAHKLSSGTPIEKVYADHSNAMKDLANRARREMVNSQSVVYSPAANKAHASQVASLNAKLDLALRNAPRERIAQVIANGIIRAKQADNPDMDSATLKKVKGLALVTARARTSAGKERIDITPDEWNAIQAGAISNNKLKKILENANIEQIKELATPRTKVTMTSTKTQRARQMLDLGYTQAEVADALGVSLSTLRDGLSE